MKPYKKAWTGSRWGRPGSSSCSKAEDTRLRTREGFIPTRFPSVRPRPLGESSAGNNTERLAATDTRVTGCGKPLVRRYLVNLPRGLAGSKEKRALAGARGSPFLYPGNRRSGGCLSGFRARWRTTTSDSRNTPSRNSPIPNRMAGATSPTRPSACLGRDDVVPGLGRRRAGVGLGAAVTVTLTALVARILVKQCLDAVMRAGADQVAGPHTTSTGRVSVADARGATGSGLQTLSLETGRRAVQSQARR